MVAQASLLLAAVVVADALPFIMGRTNSVALLPLTAVPELATGALEQFIPEPTVLSQVK
jgi:hypothetical protein